MIDTEHASRLVSAKHPFAAWELPEDHATLPEADQQAEVTRAQVLKANRVAVALEALVAAVPEIAVALPPSAEDGVNAWVVRNQFN